MVSPSVKCVPRAAVAHPLYCVGHVTRRGQSRLLTPPQADKPTLVCFSSRQAAANACRVLTFCTPGQMLLVGANAIPKEGTLSVIVVSHVDLAQAGWVDYNLDMCELDTKTSAIHVIATFACRGDAPVKTVSRSFEARL